ASLPETMSAFIAVPTRKASAYASLSACGGGAARAVDAAASTAAARTWKALRLFMGSPSKGARRRRCGGGISLPWVAAGRNGYGAWRHRAATALARERHSRQRRSRGGWRPGRARANLPGLATVADPKPERRRLQAFGPGHHPHGTGLPRDGAHDRQRQPAEGPALGRGEGGQVARVAVVGGDQRRRALDLEAHQAVGIADGPPLRVQHAQGDEGQVAAVVADRRAV